MHLPLSRWTHAQSRRAGFLAAAYRAIFRARQRRALGQLEDHILQDIGLTRTEAEREAARPFWDGPNHWRR